MGFAFTQVFVAVYAAPTSDPVFRAGFSGAAAHDSPSTVLGNLGVSNAQGPVSLVGGSVVGRAGDAGGTFDVQPAGGAISVRFNPAGMFAALAVGESRSTGITVTVTDGLSQAVAVIVVLVSRALSAPRLLSAIPDRTDYIQPGAGQSPLQTPRLLAAIPDQMDFAA